MKRNLIYVYIVVCVNFWSCGKEFLDIKRQSNQVVPKDIPDYEKLINNFNIFCGINATELALIGSDEYTISDVRFNALSQAYQRNAYIWAEDIFEGTESGDWNRGYQQILYANMALDVEKIAVLPDRQAQKDKVKGSALFLRSLAFYQLAQLFAPDYHYETGKADLGIPLRTDYDVQVRYERGSVSAIYDRLTTDLNAAIGLLPDKADSKYEASKLASLTLLARVYLHMGDYQNAARCAGEALEIDGSLVNFNTLDRTLVQSFPGNYGADNPEVIFYQACNSTIVNSARLNVDQDLLNRYEDGDLRKAIYFARQSDGRVSFKGSYSGGTGGYFTGLAIDELYLIQAESLTRLGSEERALPYLNKLLENRYNQHFVPLTIMDKQILLKRVLDERRKELYMRGIRWYDMRRLDKESSIAQDYWREVNGELHRLKSGSNRFIWPLPDNEVDRNGIPQNIR